MKNLCSILVVLAVACISVSFCTSIPGLSFDAAGGKVKLAHGGDMYSFRLVKLQEMKNATHMVVGNSTQMHSYDGFQSVTFTVGPTTTTNATTTAPEFESTVLEAVVPLGNNNNITIKINAIFASGNGTFAFAPYTITAPKVGQASVAFLVQNWRFCEDACNNNGMLETGKFLDATFEVKSKTAGAFSNSSSDTATFGKATMKYSDQVFVDYDTSPHNLTAGYPMFSVMSDKLNMTIRIPKFSTYAKYGTLDVNVDTTTTTTSGAAGKAASGIASLLAVFVAVLIC